MCAHKNSTSTVTFPIFRQAVFSYIHIYSQRSGELLLRAARGNLSPSTFFSFIFICFRLFAFVFVHFRCFHLFAWFSDRTTHSLKLFKMLVLVRLYIVSSQKFIAVLPKTTLPFFGRTGSSIYFGDTHTDTYTQLRRWLCCRRVRRNRKCVQSREETFRNFFSILGIVSKASRG